MRARRTGAVPIAAVLGAAAVGLAACSGIALVDAKTYVDGIRVETPAFGALPEGTYRGAYAIAVPAGSVAMAREFAVAVDLAEDAGSRRIAAIRVEKPDSYPDEAFMPTMISRVVDFQSLAVDSVSGATFSSKAFLKAVEDALD